MTLVDRFHASYTVDPETGCWLWARFTNEKGYAYFFADRTVIAHRWSYETFVGPIPPGDEIDHECHTSAVEAGTCAGGKTCPHRRCVNPAHLAPVDHQTNVDRGRASRAAAVAETHCKRGHEWNDENTYINPKGSRVCRPCARLLRSKGLPHADLDRP